MLPVSKLTFILMAGCLIALALLLAASARQGRPRPLPGDRTLLLRHNTLFRWLALLAAVVLPILLTALLYLYPPKRPEVPYLVAAYLILALVTLPLVWEAGRYYLRVTPDGLECRSPWRGGRSLAWADVEAVNYSGVNAWFEFVGREGDRLRVHSFVAGLNDLLRVVEAEVPAAALKGARAGYARVGRPFPTLPDEPVLEARRPKRVGDS